MRLLFAVAFLSTLASAGAAPFDFAVYRMRFGPAESGQLKIADSGVSYRSDNGKTSFDLPLRDVRKADLSDPRRIRLELYDVSKLRAGGEKILTFRLRDGEHGEELARFLSQHLSRPVVGSYALPTKPAFAIPAYHRELLGGQHGTLTVSDDGIRFLGDGTKGSRTWLYRDIETIGTSDPFHFRVTSYAETFTFDLKERLPEAAYRLAWERLYGAAGRGGEQ